MSNKKKRQTTEIHNINIENKKLSISLKNSALFHFYSMSIYLFCVALKFMNEDILYILIPFFF